MFHFEFPALPTVTSTVFRKVPQKLQEEGVPCFKGLQNSRTMCLIVISVGLFVLISLSEILNKCC